MTFTVPNKISAILKIAACVSVVAIASTSAHAQSSGAFAAFPGSWSGNGSITIANGGNASTERIRCKGTYSVNNDGNGLKQSLRCASDSYRFDLNSNVTAKGNALTGSWGEESRGVNGTLQGSISNGQVDAFVETNAFAATFEMATTGNRQTVNIASKGDIRAVNITLTKAK